MQTIAVVSRKGGTGKTTLAIHLSVAAEQSGLTTALIDLDPQASAAEWHDTRDNETPAVISSHTSRLSQTLHIAKENGAALAVLDTAPHTESAALDAACAADFAIIPCKPSLIDLRAIRSTIKIILLANVPTSIVLNAVPSRGELAEQARVAISGYGVPCTRCEIGNRVAFVHAYTAGLTVQEYEPKGKASNEIWALYSYIANEMGLEV